MSDKKENDVGDVSQNNDTGGDNQDDEMQLISVDNQLQAALSDLAASGRGEGIVLNINDIEDIADVVSDDNVDSDDDVYISDDDDNNNGRLFSLAGAILNNPVFLDLADNHNAGVNWMEMNGAGTGENHSGRNGFIDSDSDSDASAQEDRVELCRVPNPVPGFVEKSMEDVYGLKVKEITELNSYDDRTYHVRVEPECILRSKVDKPVDIDNDYIFKITNLHDTNVPDLVQAQNRLVKFLHESAFTYAVQLPFKDKNGALQSLRFVPYENRTVQFVNGQLKVETSDESVSGSVHYVRLLKYIPGVTKRTSFNAMVSNELVYKIGKCMALMHRALKTYKDSFFHLKHYFNKWSLETFEKVQRLFHIVEDEKRRDLLKTVMRKFVANKAHWRNYRKGQIHGDFNGDNILLKEGTVKIVGFLDFGDSHHSYLIFDIAIAVMYAILESKVDEPIAVGGHFLAGYMSEEAIPIEEFQDLFCFVAARFCQSLVYGLDASKNDPENQYVLATQQNGWQRLSELWQTGEESVYERWVQIIRSYGISYKRVFR